jgi:hypothetical protein
MTKTTTITVSGGFHNADEITLRAQIDPRGGIKLSEGQAKRLGDHMCGVKGCICGMHHGWLVRGISRNDLSEALADANYASYLNSSRNR